ncbi:pilus assembly FimT family protein [Nitratifractor salsuginis]|uniref:Type II secretion system protein K n=1 Tax=Nitratifractor salsuginis (strain DSM 16511 / JCM 12458 / E9I37-1) TaxID=749222 RepID=E6WY76_NITSE|nr:hypothetical protein [Nitratifractor salsuginis]ADV45324.1 hypothetical protein Nitsa_0051 [Nitratifractor salsuginis DSM 16511]
MKEARQRKGVTLLITLSVIAAMLALIAVLFGYLQEARDKADSQAALIQSDLIRADVQNFLEKYLKGHPTKSAMRNLYASPVVIMEKEGNYNLTAQCTPLLDRIPLVWLGRNEDGKYQRYYHLALGLFERLAEQAELKEPERLLAMLEAELRGRHLSLGVSDDLDARPFSMTPALFHNLLDDYRFLADDPHVYRIEWSNYFLIQTPGKVPQKLDKDFLNPQTVAYLFNIDPAIVKEDYRLGDLDKFLRSIGEESKRYDWLMGKLPQANVHCELLYSFREGRYNISFDYSKQRILNFELAK